jgi:hypothetical protein
MTNFIPVIIEINSRNSRYVTGYGLDERSSVPGRSSNIFSSSLSSFRPQPVPTQSFTCSMAFLSLDVLCIFISELILASFHVASYLNDLSIFVYSSLLYVLLNLCTSLLVS